MCSGLYECTGHQGKTSRGYIAGDVQIQLITDGLVIGREDIQFVWECGDHIKSQRCPLRKYTRPNTNRALGFHDLFRLDIVKANDCMIKITCNWNKKVKKSKSIKRKLERVSEDREKREKKKRKSSWKSFCLDSVYDATTARIMYTNNDLRVDLKSKICCKNCCLSCKIFSIMLSFVWQIPTSLTAPTVKITYVATGTVLSSTVQRASRQHYSRCKEHWHNTTVAYEATGVAFTSASAQRYSTVIAHAATGTAFSTASAQSHREILSLHTQQTVLDSKSLCLTPSIPSTWKYTTSQICCAFSHHFVRENGTRDSHFKSITSRPCQWCITTMFEGKQIRWNWWFRIWSKRQHVATNTIIWRSSLIMQRPISNLHSHDKKFSRKCICAHLTISKIADIDPIYGQICVYWVLWCSKWRG